MQFAQLRANIRSEAQKLHNLGSIGHAENFIPDRERQRGIGIGILSKLRMLALVVFEPFGIGAHVLLQFASRDDGGSRLDCFLASFDGAITADPRLCGDSDRNFADVVGLQHLGARLIEFAVGAGFDFQTLHSISLLICSTSDMGRRYHPRMLGISDRMSSMTVYSSARPVSR